MQNLCYFFNQQGPAFDPEIRQTAQCKSKKLLRNQRNAKGIFQSDKSIVSQPKNIYIQRQGAFSQQCGLHALNNLLGFQCFKKLDLQEICSNLSDSFINPHKSIFGGDYDINVLLIALQQKNLKGEWLDSRKTIDFNGQNISQNIKGYIINTSQSKSLYHDIIQSSGNHWFAVRRIENIFYQIDSLKLGVAKIVNLQKYLNKKRLSGDQIFLICQNQRKQLQFNKTKKTSLQNLRLIESTSSQYSKNQKTPYEIESIKSLQPQKITKDSQNDLTLSNKG